MNAIATLLVVCIGNVCRSPMAEALLRARLPGVDVRSAGLDARDGQPADPHAVELMRARGLDIAAHRAHRVPPGLASGADLILTMDAGQRRRLEHRLPAMRGRVFTLGMPDSFNGRVPGFDIPDPYRGPRASFEHCLRLIERGVDAWCARIAPGAPSTRIPTDSNP
jgi:protein-tyrosine phosphatase